MKYFARQPFCHASRNACPKPNFRAEHGTIVAASTNIPTDQDKTIPHRGQMRQHPSRYRFINNFTFKDPDCTWLVRLLSAKRKTYPQNIAMMINPSRGSQLSRDLFHQFLSIRSEPNMQLDRLLAIFSESMYLLENPSYRELFSMLLFDCADGSLLLNKFKNNPEFAEKISQFITHAVDNYEKTLNIDVLVFLLTVNHRIHIYAKDHDARHPENSEKLAAHFQDSKKKFNNFWRSKISLLTRKHCYMQP